MKQGLLPSCIQLHLEHLRQRSLHNLLWQVVPVRDYSNGCGLLVVTGFILLLADCENMTAKTKAGGGSKNCVAWITEKAKHYFAHTDEVTTASSMD